MKVYSFDNVLITTPRCRTTSIYKLLDTMEKNKDDLVAVQPVCGILAGVRLQAIWRARITRAR